MTKEINKCQACATYTLETICPRCGQKAITPKPAKFSIDDKYGKYRRIHKQGMERQKAQKNQS